MFRRARQSTRPGLWLAAGLGVGVALGWLTAPRRGNWLRSQLRQKMEHWRRLGRRRLDRDLREIENKVQGVVAEVREAWDGHDHYVDANTLVDQVHSQIGREFHPLLEHVNLNGVGHTIFLHGHVRSEDERARLVAAIRGIEGVEAVREEYPRVGPISLRNEPATQPENEYPASAQARPRRRAPRRSS